MRKVSVTICCLSLRLFAALNEFVSLCVFKAAHSLQTVPWQRSVTISNNNRQHHVEQAGLTSIRAALWPCRESRAWVVLKQEYDVTSMLFLVYTPLQGPRSVQRVGELILLECQSVSLFITHGISLSSFPPPSVELL